jgi:hypothetical protein
MDNDSSNIAVTTDQSVTNSVTPTDPNASQPILTAPITPIVETITFDDIMTERKQKLDEAKFRLDQRKAIHDMDMEKQRENFSETQVTAGAPTEHWLQSFWRPAAAWVYMAICIFDFILAPIFSMFMPVVYKVFGVTVAYIPWTSLTLQNGGIIHISFGAILGVSAYTRGIELSNAASNKSSN